MNEQSKIKLIFSIIIFSLIVGGVVLPLDFALSQSYMVDFEGHYLLAWGSPTGGIPTRINYIERSISLPYYGRYEVTTYYNANSGQDQLFEEFKVLVDERYIGQTSDPNSTLHGPDYETEYLGEHDFTAGNHQVRLEHLWNYADVGYQSVHLQKVTFILKEIFSPELSLSKSVDKSTAQEGEILTYILFYQNRGSGSASGVVLTDDYDENHLDIYDSGGGTVSGGKISWNIGTLGMGSSGTRLFKVKVKEGLPVGTTYIYNKAIIDSTQTDPLESNIVTTRVTVINLPPSANAGPDKEIYERQSTTLLGSGSDPDGDPITYQWSCAGGSLSNRYIARPTYTAPEVSYDRTYTCSLTVTDTHGVSDSDSMNVLVKNYPLPIIDIKANNSDGPVTLYYKDYVTLSWTSQNAASCIASGDWSGSEPTSGSKTVQLNSVKTYTFTLSCVDTNGTQTSTDSVQVIVRPKLPTVITKPAVVTL